MLGFERKSSSKGSIVGSDDINVKFKGEVIRDNLCISVQRGLDMTKQKKENNDKQDKIILVEEKKHTSYLTTISIINSEIPFKHAFKQSTFDNYRMLNQELAFYSLDPQLYEKYLRENDFKILLRENDQEQHLVWIAQYEG